MNITILGCGSSAGVPMIGGADGLGEWGECDPAEPRNRRSRASILIENVDEQRLLVDCSPDMRGQLLAARVPRIDAVLFTHAHADHIAGLDDVRILNRIAGRPLEAFADPATLAELTQRFNYAFQPWTGPGFFKPAMLPRPVTPGDIVEAAGLTIRTFGQDHGFSRSLGLRVGGFAYCTDVVRLDEDAMGALGGLECWVVDCFQRAEHPSHAWLDRVAGWVARLRPRRTVLTHMGPDLDWGWMTRNLPSGIEPAHDGMVLDCP